MVSPHSYDDKNDGENHETENAGGAGGIRVLLPVVTVLGIFKEGTHQGQGGGGKDINLHGSFLLKHFGCDLELLGDIVFPFRGEIPELMDYGALIGGKLAKIREHITIHEFLIGIVGKIQKVCRGAMKSQGEIFQHGALQVYNLASFIFIDGGLLLSDQTAKIGLGHSKSGTKLADLFAGCHMIISFRK
jgi:hypothetical protein